MDSVQLKLVGPAVELLEQVVVVGLDPLQKRAATPVGCLALEALKGARSLFGKTEVFILETSLYEFMPGMPVTAECVEFMTAKGYAIYDVIEYLRRPLDGALGQIDLAFARRDGILRSSHAWSF